MTLDWKNPRIKTHSIWLSKNGDFDLLKVSDFGQKEFHGRFHPEIPYQMMLRYTEQGDLVWDCFAGGGTTIDVGKLLGRRVVANDIFPTRPEIIKKDSRVWHPAEQVDLVILHPPYWKMIKFSEDQRDLCNCDTSSGFIESIGWVIEQVCAVLKPKHYMALVISDVYTGGEQVPLGSLCYPRIVEKGFRLKGKIVKDFGETKGSATTNARTKNLWRYRAVKSGFWELGIDEIWVYQKR